MDLKFRPFLQKTELPGESSQPEARGSVAAPETSCDFSGSFLSIVKAFCKCSTKSAFMYRIKFPVPILFISVTSCHIFVRLNKNFAGLRKTGTSGGHGLCLRLVVQRQTSAPIASCCLAPRSCTTCLRVVSLASTCFMFRSTFFPLSLNNMNLFWFLLLLVKKG